MAGFEVIGVSHLLILLTELALIILSAVNHHRRGGDHTLAECRHQLVEGESLGVHVGRHDTLCCGDYPLSLDSGGAISEVGPDFTCRRRTIAAVPEVLGDEPTFILQENGSVVGRAKLR